MVGVTDVPWPIAGIHGTALRSNPACGAPVVASVIDNCIDTLPRVGGWSGAVRTSTLACPESLFSTTRLCTGKELLSDDGGAPPQAFASNTTTAIPSLMTYALIAQA